MVGVSPPGNSFLRAASKYGFKDFEVYSLTLWPKADIVMFAG